MTRNAFVAIFASVIAGLAWSAASAEDTAAPATAATAPAPAGDDAVAEKAAKAASTDTEYTPPPGFKTKTRKGETVYCRSRAPLGTRIKNEECFTEAQIKEVERAMATSTEDIQQRGRMCTTGFMCTGQGGG